MRSAVLAWAALVLAACDQGPIPGPDALWTGSIGRLVVAGDHADAFTFRAQADSDPGDGRMSWVPVDGAEFDGALHLETLGQPPRMESLQARIVTSGEIDGNATCWLHAEARVAEPQVELGLGRLEIVARPTDGDLPAFLRHAIYLEPAWTTLDFSFIVPAGLDAGEAEIVFNIGTQSQAIDLADVFMRCFDDIESFPNLPQSTFTYAGREAEAPWRVTANNQIERYRKGDLIVEVTDAGGNPVPDAEIHIQMIDHAFEFGTSIDSGLLAGEADQGGGQSSTVAYRNNLGELFNTVTFDEALRWSAWQDPEQRVPAEKALAWAHSLGLGLRGRGLVSTDVEELPPALQDKRGQPSEIRDAVRRGVTDTVGALNGKISAWEVVNQARERNDLLALVGEDELGTWFRLAREAAAEETKLVLNEGGILSGDRMAALASLLGRFLSDGVPIDRIGVHGRFDTQPPPIQVLSDRLDQLASFELPLVITAFDLISTDDRIKADFTRDFLTLAFSHPSVEGFMFEHFQGSKAGIALYREDGAITPIGEIYRRLVLEDWWTDILARSNVEGQLVSRVFQGKYTVSARKDGLRASAMLVIGPDGEKVSLELAEASDAERAL